MKTPNTTTTSSTTKLLNKKLNVNLNNTPKYVENKIYITTKQVQHNPNPLGISNQNNHSTSMKKVIQTKLDIIKQQISRQINQHYKKQILKQSRTQRNTSQLSNRIIKNNNNNNNASSSRSRVKSEKNNTTMTLSASNSRAVMKRSHSKMSQNGINNNSQSYKRNNQRVHQLQQQNLKPTRLFQTFFPQAQQQLQSKQSHILGQSISKINHPTFSINYLKQKGNNNYNCNHNQHNNLSSSYKEKYLNLNEKYLEEKQRLIQSQNMLNKVLNSVQGYFIHPEQNTLKDMVCYLEQVKINYTERSKQFKNSSINRLSSYQNNSNSNNNNSNNKNMNKNYNDNNNNEQQQQQVSRMQQNARYMLACYEDIQQFKQQLDHLLQITSTRSLQQLKSLLSHKFSLTSTSLSSKQRPQSIDQFTYRFLQLQASNNRLKQEYERMIEDVREKGEMELIQMRRQCQKEKIKINSRVRELQGELVVRDGIYQKVLMELNKLTIKYSIQLKEINSNNNNNNNKLTNNNNDKNNDHIMQNRHFVQKIKKLSQFKLQESQNVHDEKGDNYDGKNNQYYSQQQSEKDSLQQKVNNYDDSDYSYKVDFTPKYNNDDKDTNNNKSINNNKNNKNNKNKQTPTINTPSPSIRNSVSIANRLPLNQQQHKQLPKQLRQLDQILSEMISQLSSIKYSAQSNIMKLRQANEDIHILDQKMGRIKDQLEGQVEEEQNRVKQKERYIKEKQQVIREKQQQINELKQRQKQLKQQLQLNNNLKSNVIQQLTTKISKYQQQISKLKDQLFNNNKKTIQLFGHNQNIDEQKKQIQQYIKLQLQGFVRTIARVEYNNNKSEVVDNNGHNEQEHHDGNGNNNNDSNNSPKHFPILPTLPSILSTHLTTINQLISKKLSRSQQHHKLYIQKQKQSFQHVQKLKTYQHSILSLQTTLNNAILQKQQYQFLLTQLRQQFQLYKQQKQQQLQLISKRKQHELINANRTILEQNAKLTHQLIEYKQQNTRINKLLEQKINQRTFYRRKSTQIQTTIQQKDSKILQLQKQCNKYRVYMEQIQKSFQDIVKNQQHLTKKISALQQQKHYIMQQVQKHKQQQQRIQQLNHLLQTENTKLRQQSNRKKMQQQKYKIRMKQLVQARQGYERVNIQLRMKSLQLQQVCDNLQQEVKKLQYQLQKQRKTVDRLERDGNQYMRRQNQFIQKLAMNEQMKERQLLMINKGLQTKDKQWLVIVEQERKKYGQLWLVVQEKQGIIRELTKEIEKFQNILQRNQQREQQIGLKEKRQFQQLRRELQKKKVWIQQREQQIKKLQKDLIKRKQQFQRSNQSIKKRQQEVISEQLNIKIKQQQLNVRQQEIKQLIDKLGEQQQGLLIQRQQLQHERQQLQHERQLAQTERQLTQTETKTKLQQLISQQSQLKERQIALNQRQHMLVNKQRQINIKEQLINKEQQAISRQKQQIEVQLNNIQVRMLKQQQQQQQKRQQNIKQQQHRPQQEQEDSIINVDISNQINNENQEQQSIKSDQCSKQQQQSLLDYLMLSTGKKQQQQLHLGQLRETSNNNNKQQQQQQQKQQQQQQQQLQQQQHNHLQQQNNVQQQLQTEYNDQQHHINSPNSPYLECISQQMNPNDIALIYSEQKLLSLMSNHKISHHTNNNNLNNNNNQHQHQHQNQQQQHQHQQEQYPDINNNKRSQQWIKQTNLILLSLLYQHQYCLTQNPTNTELIKINQLQYYQQIKHNYNKVLFKLLRQPTPLQLDLSQIEYKHSISSSSSINGNKLFGVRFNSSQNQQRQDMFKQTGNLQTFPKTSSIETSYPMRYFTLENNNNPKSHNLLLSPNNNLKQISNNNNNNTYNNNTNNNNNNMYMETFPRSNTADKQLQADLSIMTYKLKVDHLSELKTMLYLKMQQMQKENTQLKNTLEHTQQSALLKEKIIELESKLYTYEDFANDQLKVGVLWNLFKQIIAAYNEEQFIYHIVNSDLQKFQRVCRILFKMLNYPQKQIDQFNIQWQNRKKKNKISSFFTKWIRDGSVEKREQSNNNKTSPTKKK